MAKEKVLVGLSGGYASSVAAFLLARQNYDVLGVFFKMMDIDQDKELKAKTLADKFDIPFKVIDVRQQEFAGFDGYKEAEFIDMNPDYEYHKNQFILKSLFKLAGELNIPMVGTGHIVKKNYLLKEKDHALFSPLNFENMQTHLVAGSDLSKLLLPLGDIPFSDIEKICTELGIKYQADPLTQKIQIVSKDPFSRGEGRFFITIKNTHYYKDEYLPLDSYIYINRTKQVIRAISYFKPFYQAYIETLEPVDTLIGEEIFVFENTSGAHQRLIGFGTVLKTKEIPEVDDTKEITINSKQSYEFF